MAYYVYILKSEKDGFYYKGFSENYQQRLETHNRGKSKFTSSKIPWKLIYGLNCSGSMKNYHIFVKTNTNIFLSAFL
jgi:predicted GIY-YIG superfamily endonuclease